LIAETKILQRKKRELQQNLDEKRKAVATAKESEANMKKNLEKVANDVTKKSRSNSKTAQHQKALLSWRQI
jgi:hypothetical protein